MRIVSFIALGAWLAASAFAQPYPAKPIRMIVTTAPGGLMDVPARIATDYLDKSLGQRVLMENRGGAGGNIGTDMVAKAPPDGYTIGFVQLGNFALNPFVFKDFPYDPLTDLVPIAPMTSSAILVVVNKNVPATNLTEFIALAKKKPKGINHGSAGLGTVPHLASELFSQRAGIELTHVHYRGAGPAVNDLVAGQVDVVFVGLGAVRAHLASGALRVLAVAQPARLRGAPEFPTSAEAGLPGFEFTTWFGFAAPKGTPAEVVSLLAKHIHTMQDDPALAPRLAAGGMEILKESPEQFRQRIRADYETFREVVRKAGLKPE